jgi:hypothetical protein
LLIPWKSKCRASEDGISRKRLRSVMPRKRLRAPEKASGTPRQNRPAKNSNTTDKMPGTKQ